METKIKSVSSVPETYLHVRDEKSGQEWVVPLGGHVLLSLERQVKEWIKSEFCGELVLDGKIMRRLSGDYYARIMTDGRPINSIVCWDGGGFYLKSSY